MASASLAGRRGIEQRIGRRKAKAKGNLGNKVGKVAATKALVATIHIAGRRAWSKGSFNLTPKGFSKGQWEPPRRKACFGCGSLDHLQRNYPKVEAAVEETGVANVSIQSADVNDVIIIGNVNASELENETVFEFPKKRKKRTEESQPE